MPASVSATPDLDRESYANIIKSSAVSTTGLGLSPDGDDSGMTGAGGSQAAASSLQAQPQPSGTGGKGGQGQGREGLLGRARLRGLTGDGYLNWKV